MKHCTHCGSPIYKVDLAIQGSFLHHTTKPELVVHLPRRLIEIMKVLLAERMATRDALVYAIWAARDREEPERAIRAIYVYLHRLRVILRPFGYTIDDYQILPWSP